VVAGIGEVKWKSPNIYVFEQGCVKCSHKLDTHTIKCL